MPNWAENPQNKRQSLQAYSLPSLLFSECHKYCLSNEFSPIESESERSCIANCQDKTYKAFDLYMVTSEHFAGRKNFRHYVDVSRFTGMEIEHKHDTSSVIGHLNDGHVHPDSVQPFLNEVNKQFKDVKDKSALN